MTQFARIQVWRAATTECCEPLDVSCKTNRELGQHYELASIAGPRVRARVSQLVTVKLKPAVKPTFCGVVKPESRDQYCTWTLAPGSRPLD